MTSNSNGKVRPKFEEAEWTYTQSPQPTWQPGSGASKSEFREHKKRVVDPYADGRNLIDNYKLLTSAITPRPIALVSSLGQNHQENLAPFSYFSLLNHEPPIFSLGISSNQQNLKDTCKNLHETRECTINLISEWFIEAANHSSINAPYGISEWELTGLTPLKSKKVKPKHVAESAFSVEGKVIHIHEWRSPNNQQHTTGYTFIIEGIMFHAREDIINEDLNQVDINKLKPISRLGGSVYARTTEGFEIPRPIYEH
ncbi:Piso0_004331 [Millerozyma farinosa CBS 7064]|uniref:Piso0_004331 protein n=1 Tax=Pichia sorbitophila (strain ATCC MYA-4447 / BCRC 22081 / CBS 7064 / NBRC 10061 / NRRL Y-12695) TaxID=559304 RepID=G8Y846_PICSO|nr:Piso0_004331 [Millerozyma farinosa CBS 7064]CCE84776.1 Piso0_004331 [Millerozyma farinosa CBS 7064]